MDVRPHAGVRAGVAALPGLLHGMRRGCGVDSDGGRVAVGRILRAAAGRFGRRHGLAARVRRHASQRAHHLHLPARAHQGQVVRGDLRRRGALHGVDGPGRQRGPLRPHRRHAVGAGPALLVEETARNLVLRRWKGISTLRTAATVRRAAR